MSEQLKSFDPTNLKDYTLLLDRDGVINMPKADDYVKSPHEFTFCDGALEALKVFQETFKYIVVVTNQQGIHREIMSESDLEDVHLKMMNGMKDKGLRYFDLVLFAPYLRSAEHPWRKPGIGMFKKAQEYLDIDPSKIIICGDSPGDMELGRSLDATCVRIRNAQFSFDNSDHIFDSLSDFAHFITQS